MKLRNMNDDSFSLHDDNKERTNERGSLGDLDDSGSSSKEQSGASAGSKNSVDNVRRKCTRLAPIVTTPSRGTSSGASSSDEENGDEGDGVDGSEAKGRTKIPSFHNSQGTPTRESRSAAGNQPSSGVNPGAAAVSADQERQILLLMLLAQVCALHDPSE